MTYLRSKRHLFIFLLLSSLHHKFIRIAAVSSYPLPTNRRRSHHLLHMILFFLHSHSKQAIGLPSGAYEPPSILVICCSCGINDILVHVLLLTTMLVWERDLEDTLQVLSVNVVCLLEMLHIVEVVLIKMSDLLLLLLLAAAAVHPRVSRNF